MRLPNSAHEAHAWRIREIVPDFTLEDVWALPVRGRLEDFARLLAVIASLDPAHAESRATRTLFSIRYRVGGWLGWDDPPRSSSARSSSTPRDTEASLSARLPEDLRHTAIGLELRSSDFTPLYRTEVEWASELANRTVHAVMHLAWAEQDRDIYQGQLAVYVKPRGQLGQLYMAAIAPFRHHIVYPALMREIERRWNARPAP
jgi:hypothetical protein